MCTFEKWLLGEGHWEGFRDKGLAKGWGYERTRRAWGYVLKRALRKGHDAT